MQTSRRLLRQVRRSLWLASALSAGITLLMLALPLFALQLIEAGVPAGASQLIFAAAGVALVALAVAAILDACREVILQRTAVWIEHRLGQELIASGLSTGAEAETNARFEALGALRDGIGHGAAAAAVGAPWALLAVAALVLVHPMLAAAALSILTLSAVVLPLAARRAQRPRVQGEACRQDADTWRRAILGNAVQLAASGKADTARDRWETLNRGVVVNGYAAGPRFGLTCVLARALSGIGFVAMLAAGAALSLAGEVSAGGAVAALLVAMRGFAAVEQLAMQWHEISAARRSWAVLETPFANAVRSATDAAPQRRAA